MTVMDVSRVRSGNVLLIDDERDLLDGLKKVLQRKGFQVRTALSGRHGLSLLADALPEVVVVDLRMPEMDGLEGVEGVRQRDPGLPVILTTGSMPVMDAVTAIKQGAYDYIAKPFTNGQLDVVLRRALEYRRLVEENRSLQAQLQQRKESGGAADFQSN